MLPHTDCPDDPVIQGPTEDRVAPATEGRVTPAAELIAALDRHTAALREHTAALLKPPPRETWARIAARGYVGQPGLKAGHPASSQ